MKIRKTVLEECGSTNVEARNARYCEGDAVLALRQTEGRGQRGRRWESSAGENLTFTVVLEPLFLRASEQFLLSQSVALAVADTLGEYGLEARLKWPNDVYVGERKICGMLIEHDLRDGRLARTLVGIGLNVNQMPFPKWIPNPTSMVIETLRRDGISPEGGGGKFCEPSYDIMDVFDVFASKFEGRYALTESGARETVRESYNHLLYRRDEPHRYSIPGRGEVTGTIRGVGPAGELSVEIESRTEEFLFREIESV